MRVLFVLPEYPPHFGGGIATFYGALAPALVRQGHAVDVLIGSAVTSGGAPYELDGVNVSFLELDRFQRWLPRFSQYDAIPAVKRHLAAAWAMFEQAGSGAGYDVVEVVDWGLLFTPWVIERRVPAVVQLHGSCGQIDIRDPSPAGALDGNVVRLLEKSLLRGAIALHTHSRSNQQEWQRLTGREVHYAPPPLNRASRPSGGQATSNRGLVVGRVQKWKGPEALCKALRVLGDRAPEVDWVGRDTVLGSTSRLMTDFLKGAYPDVWGRHVIHHQQRSPEEVAALQAAARFVVVPSTWDMFNLTAVEAMREGNVVICSDGAGAVDLIEDGINGFTFPAGDARRLARQIERMRGLSMPERLALSEAAMQTTCDMLDPDRIAVRKVESYAQAIVAEASPVSPWASEAARPAEASAKRGAFLEQQPLSALLSHSARRVGRRIAVTMRSLVP